MKELLIKQGIAIPFVYFMTVIVGAAFAVNYSHIGQHVSELAINSSSAAKLIFDIGISLTSISIIFFAIGILLKFRSKFSVSVGLIMLFGITFIFGVIFPIGSPWHGAYGIGFSVVFLPTIFLFELGKDQASTLTKFISYLATFSLGIYFWFILAQLYPVELRGLMQRIFGIALFGFISYTAFILSQLSAQNDTP